MTSKEFEEKYVCLAPRLYKVAFALLQNAQDAEDAVQETLVKLWRDAERVQQMQSPEGYIMRILRNHCLDLMHERHDETELLHAEHTVAAPAPPPELETNEYLERIIQALPSKIRKILTMRHVAACSIDEICEATGETPSNVRQILSRTRRKIASQLNILFP
jgi:RNA polymerase sigma-70 factor (ECF subfamily)